MPRVSFCIPNLDMAPFLARCVESCLAQTYADLEVVLVDNRSGDDSLAVARSLARRDGRVRVHENEARLPMAANWNRSVELARGEYVTLLCADDAQELSFAAELVPLLEAHPEVVYACCERHDIDLEDRVLATHRFYEQSAVIPGLAEAEVAIASNHAVMNQLLVRRSAWLAAGGSDTRFDWAHDIHLKLKLLLRGDVAYVTEPLARYRQNPAASSARMLTSKLGVMEIHRARLDFLATLPPEAVHLRARLPAVCANHARLALRHGLTALAGPHPAARTLAEEYLHLALAFDLGARATPLFERLEAALAGRPAPAASGASPSGPPYPLPRGARPLCAARCGT